MRAARLSLLSVLVAAAGCATLPPCPARGGPAWTELRSPHVDLLTDLDPEDAKAALRDFEELRAAVLVAAWRRAPEPPGRIVVIVLREGAERRVFVPNGFIGSFVSNNRLHQSFLVKSGNERDETVIWGVAYELGHRYGLQGKAPWFDEGLARYLGPLTLGDDGKLTYGQVDPQLFRALTLGLLTDFDNLWQPVTPETRGRFLATSWLAVHYLFNREPERFARFQRLLIEKAEARAAWDEVFPDLRGDAMTARLREYVFREGQYAAFETRLPPIRYDAEILPVSDARVHAIRAVLYSSAGTTSEAERPALVRAEVNEALRLDPRELMALYVQRLYLHEKEDDVTVPQELVAAHPENALGWILLARAHQLRNEPDLAREAEKPLRALAPPEAPVGVDVRIARPD